MSKIDPKNQIITVRGKVVDFDNLPLHLQEKLLTSWRIKSYKKDDRTKEKDGATKENSGRENRTKGATKESSGRENRTKGATKESSGKKSGKS